MTKTVDRRIGTAEAILWKHNSEESADRQAPGIIEETDEFRTTVSTWTDRK
jgi:hypothetical protein